MIFINEAAFFFEITELFWIEKKLYIHDMGTKLYLTDLKNWDLFIKTCEIIMMKIIVKSIVTYYNDYNDYY